MRKTDNGYTIYETLDELVSAGINSASEDNDFYYIWVKPEHEYDERVWKVDKKTGKVSRMDYVVYICTVKSKAKEINPTTLRRGA